MRDAQMNLIKLSLIHSLLTGSSRENAVVGRGMSVSKSYCVSGRWSTWPSHLTLPLQWTATYCLPFPAQVGTHLSNTEGELRERAEIVQALNNMQAFQWARLYEADTTSGQGRLREITRGLMSAEKIRKSATLELRKLSSSLWGAFNWGAWEALCLLCVASVPHDSSRPCSAQKT